MNLPVTRSNYSQEHGFGMVELMIAVLVFSLGLAGARSAQFIAMQSNYESLQRTQASIFALEMVERILSNPSAVETYVELGGYWDGGEMVEATECAVQICSAAQLAAADVRQWHAQMLGSSTRLNKQWVARLRDIKACIARLGWVIEVRVSWSVATAQPLPMEAGCLAGGGASTEKNRAQLFYSTVFPA
ncbi:MAG: type IV pilus modification protein PilV [Halioglobus sp.]